MNKIIKVTLASLIFFLALNFVSFESPVSKNKANIIQVHNVLTIDAPVAQAYKPGDVSFLTSMLNGTNRGNRAWLISLYGFSRGLLNLALFGFLVYVAFRNILNLGVDNYGVKRLLPKIIAAAFLGNIIMPVFAVVSRLVDSLHTLTIFEPRVYDWMSIIGTMPKITSITGVWGLVAALIAPSFAAGTIALSLGLIALLILGVLLVLCLLISLFLALRPWIILLGIAVGPVAIALFVIPETEGLFKKWLKIMVFWMFYPLILYAIRYIALLVPTTGEMMGAADDGAVSTLLNFSFPIIVKIILFFAAVRAPFNWEKDLGGFIEKLPETVKGGVQKLDRANRAVYGSIGTRAYQEMRRGGTKAFEKGMKDSDAQVKADTAAHMATPEGQAGKTRLAVDLMRDKLGKDQATLDKLSGGKLPTLDKLQQFYDQYRANPTTFASANAEQSALASFFRTNEVPSTTEADKMYQSQWAAEKRLEYGAKAEGDWRDNNWYAKTLMFAQEQVPSGLSTYARLLNEGFSSDMKKMEFRYNKPVQLMASYAPEAYIKDHKERKKGDHNPLDEEGLERDLGSKKRDEALIIAKHLGITDEDEAMAVHQALHKKYFDGQETNAVYAKMFYGKKATLQKRNRNTGALENKEVTIDGDMLASNISAYEKQRTLAASAARSSVALEQQKYLRQQQQNKFWMRSGPSGGTGQRDAATQARIQAQAPISPAERRIIQGIEGLRKDIKLTSGVEALNRLNTSFAEVSFDDLKPEEYANFYFDAKDDRHSVNDRLLEKAGNDPSKRQRVSEFINDLESSRGLEASIMIDRAKREFGDDPEVERLIADYSAKSQMDLVITQKNPEAKDLQQKASGFAQRATQDPSIIEQTTKAIDNYYRQHELSPEVAKQAKDYIASQIGISDGSAVSEAMVKGLSKQVNVVKIRNPETE